MHGKTCCWTNYSWADRAQGKVRIPIEQGHGTDRAAGTAGCAQRGTGPLLTGDDRPVVAVAIDQWICPHRLRARPMRDAGSLEAKRPPSRRSRAADGWIGVCGFPPFRKERKKGWGTQQFGHGAVWARSSLGTERFLRTQQFRNRRNQEEMQSANSMRRGWAGAVKVAARRGPVVLRPARVLGSGPGFQLRRKGGGPGQRKAAVAAPRWALPSISTTSCRSTSRLPTTQGSRCNWPSYFGKKPRHSGAGLLPVPHALLGRAEWADQRAADGRLRSRQGLQHHRGQHRSQRGHRPGRRQEAQLPQALRRSRHRLRLAFPHRHAAQHRRVDQGGWLRLRQDPRPRRQTHPVCPCQLHSVGDAARASWRSTTWASSTRPRICASAWWRPRPIASDRRSTTF